MRITHPTGRPNYSVLETEAYALHFSYETPIVLEVRSVHGDARTLYRRPNDWGPTTGKHFNAAIGGRTAEALSSSEFVDMIRYCET